MSKIAIKLPNGGMKWSDWNDNVPPESYAGSLIDIWKAYFKDIEALRRLVTNWFTKEKIFKVELSKLNKLWNLVYGLADIDFQERSPQIIWNEHLEHDLYLVLKSCGLENLSTAELHTAILKILGPEVEKDFNNGLPLNSKESKNIPLADLDAPRSQDRATIGEHGDQRDTYAYATKELEKVRRAESDRLTRESIIDLDQAERELPKAEREALRAESPLTQANRQAKKRAQTKLRRKLK